MIELTKKQKHELMKKANIPTNDLGREGNSTRLLNLLQKEGYLKPIYFIDNISYGYTMNNVLCWHHKSTGVTSTLISQIVMIQCDDNHNVIDFAIVD